MAGVWESLSENPTVAGGAAGRAGASAASAASASASASGRSAISGERGPVSDVLRKRMNRLHQMLNSFNAGGVDDFPELVKELYHDVRELGNSSHEYHDVRIYGNSSHEWKGSRERHD
jgi:hypothetical protein